MVATGTEDPVFSTLTPGPARATRIVALIVVATALVTFVTDGWSSGRLFSQERTRLSRMPLTSRENLDATGLNTAFLSWARHKLLSSEGNAATFWLSYRKTKEPADLYQWALYQLSPAHETATAKQARWIIIYGETPASARLRPARWRVTNYAAKYALAQAISR